MQTTKNDKAAAMATWLFAANSLQTAVVVGASRLTAPFDYGPARTAYLHAGAPIAPIGVQRPRLPAGDGQNYQRLVPAVRAEFETRQVTRTSVHVCHVDRPVGAAFMMYCQRPGASTLPQARAAVARAVPSPGVEKIPCRRPDGSARAADGVFTVARTEYFNPVSAAFAVLFCCSRIVAGRRPFASVSCGPYPLPRRAAADADAGCARRCTVHQQVFACWRRTDVFTHSTNCCSLVALKTACRGDDAQRRQYSSAADCAALNTGISRTLPMVRNATPTVTISPPPTAATGSTVALLMVISASVKPGEPC